MLVWIFSLLFIALGACAQASRIPDVIPDSVCCIYNLPASIRVSGHNIHLSGSFLYWHVDQQYMDASRHALSSSVNVSSPAPEAHVLLPEFGYQPGFKIRFGYDSDLDGWDVFAEYTWLHQQTNRSTENSNPATVWPINNWFAGGRGLAASSMNLNWKMNLDQIDLCFSRPFAQGRYLFVYPSMGLQSLLVRQTYTITAPNPTSSPFVSVNRSECWSIGPEISAFAHALIQKGFRLTGGIQFGLLYTRFTKLTHKEVVSPAFIISGSEVPGSMNGISALLPNTSAALGVSWGSYLSKNLYHIDFSALYDFKVLWGQNRMRNLVSNLGDTNNIGYPTAPAGNLSMHGVTINARICF